MTQPGLIRLIARVAVVFGIAAIAAYLGADILARAWIDAFASVISRLMPEFHIDGLAAEYRQGERVFALTATNAQALLLGGATFPAGITVTATTLAGHVLQHYVLFFTVVLGWPGLRPLVRVTAALLGLLLLFTAQLVDTPFVLANATYELLYANSHAAAGSLRWLQWWATFLDDGGRILMGVVEGLVAVALAQWHARTLVQRGREL